MLHHLCGLLSTEPSVLFKQSCSDRYWKCWDEEYQQPILVSTRKHKKMPNRSEHLLAGVVAPWSEKITGAHGVAGSRSRTQNILDFFSSNDLKLGWVLPQLASRALRVTCGEGEAVQNDCSDLQLCCGKEGKVGAISLRFSSGYILQPTHWPVAEQGYAKF